MLSKVVTETGALEVTFEDGLKVQITPHGGTAAIRAARLVKRLNASKLKIIGQAKAEAAKLMTKEEKERMTELAQKLATKELLDSEQKAIEKEMELISLKYEDQGANIKAMAEIQEAIDPDQEAELDALLFANTTSNKGKLSDPVVFDRVFSGKNWVKIEPIRNLIIEHNDFLGNGAVQAPKAQAEDQ